MLAVGPLDTGRGGEHTEKILDWRGRGRELAEGGSHRRRSDGGG